MIVRLVWKPDPRGYFDCAAEWSVGDFGGDAKIFHLGDQFKWRTTMVSIGLLDPLLHADGFATSLEDAQNQASEWTNRMAELMRRHRA